MSMDPNKVRPVKYRVFVKYRALSSPDAEYPVHNVIDSGGKIVCSCDRPWNAKLICNLLERFS